MFFGLKDLKKPVSILTLLNNSLVEHTIAIKNKFCAFLLTLCSLETFSDSDGCAETGRVPVQARPWERGPPFDQTRAPRRRSSFLYS